MRLFLLGAPCAGKTTLMAPLRRELTCPVLDMDEEILRVNHGVWPHLDRKRGQTRHLIAELSEQRDVVLAYSIIDDEDVTRLREKGWCIVLLDLPEAVMRERAAERERREGWSNIQWLPTHIQHIERLRGRDAFDAVLDATRPVEELVAGVVRLAEPSRPGPPPGPPAGSRAPGPHPAPPAAASPP